MLSSIYWNLGSVLLEINNNNKCRNSGSAGLRRRNKTTLIDIQGWLLWQCDLLEILYDGYIQAFITNYIREGGRLWCSCCLLYHVMFRFFCIFHALIFSIADRSINANHTSFRPIDSMWGFIYFKSFVAFLVGFSMEERLHVKWTSIWLSYLYISEYIIIFKSLWLNSHLIHLTAVYVFSITAYANM